MGDGRVAGRGKWVAAVVQQRVPGGSRRLHRGVGCNMGRNWQGKVGGGRAASGGVGWISDMVHGGWVAAVGRWVGAMGRDGAAALIHPQYKVPNKSCRHAGLQVTFPAALLAQPCAPLGSLDRDRQ